jgi:RsmE family RNA methyltransferase
MNGSEKSDFQEIENIIIGPEGGFSSNELELFKEEQIIGFKTDNVLKSETAAVAISAKIIL